MSGLHAARAAPPARPAARKPNAARSHAAACRASAGLPVPAPPSTLSIPSRSFIADLHASDAIPRPPGERRPQGVRKKSERPGFATAGIWSKPPDRVHGRRDLGLLRLIVERPDAARSTVESDLGPQREARQELVRHPERYVVEARGKARALEDGGANAFVVAEPLGPQSRTPLFVQGVEEIGSHGVPVGVPLASGYRIGRGVLLDPEVTARGKDPSAVLVELRGQVARDRGPVVMVVVGLLRPGDPGRHPVVPLVGRIPDEGAVESG